MPVRLVKHLLSAGVEKHAGGIVPLHHQGGFADVECIASDAWTG